MIKELPGAKLSVIDEKGNVVESWTSEAGKTYLIERLPVGKYTLREESAPYGYKVAKDVTFEVKETAEIQKVAMKDEQVVGKIVIEKTDKVTGKPIEGVVFEIRDKDGKVVDTLTTDKKGHAESKELPICTYNEDGSFKEDIHYTAMIDMAEQLDIVITDVIVDESANDDIDRAVVTDFCQTLDEVEAEAVFVNDILDFTSDPDDLLKFVDTLLNRPVILFDMKRHHAWLPDILDESDSAED